MDRLSPERRSWLMSRVRSKNTAPEMVVRRLVFAMGYRYRLHVSRLPGRPDLVFPARRKIVFVHGCFWHGHKGCRYARLPKSHIEFWRTKRSRNRTRDRKVLADLEKGGWDVLVVWQCELKDLARVADKLYEFLEKTG